MEPQIVFLADIGDLVDGVERSITVVPPVAETKNGLASSARASWIRASRSSGIIIPLEIQNQITYFEKNTFFMVSSLRHFKNFNL